MPRSPEIITEPVVHDDLLDALRVRQDRFATSLSRMDDGERFSAGPGPVIPSGYVGSAIDFIAYWQAVGQRLARHGYRDRAELEATFDLAFAKAGLDGWTGYAHDSPASIMVVTPDHSTPPLFTARWVDPSDTTPVYGAPVETACWYSQHGFWSGDGGVYHDTIADLIDHHRKRA